MRGSANSSIAQYAVIEARSSQGSSERFVCTYGSEQSLRDLIAGPSIIACGFASREEALANLDTRVRTAARKRIQRIFAFCGARKSHTRVRSAEARSVAGSYLTHKARVVGGFIAVAVASAASTFYSRNAMFTVLRFFAGDSL